MQRLIALQPADLAKLKCDDRTHDLLWSYNAKRVS